MASKTISAGQIWLWLNAPGDAWKPCKKWREYQAIENNMGGPNPITLDHFLELGGFTDNEKLWALLRTEYVSPPVLGELANELMVRTDRLMLTAWPERKNPKKQANGIRLAIDKAVDDGSQTRAYAITYFVGTHVNAGEYPFYMKRLKELLSAD